MRLVISVKTFTRCVRGGTWVPGRAPSLAWAEGAAEKAFDALEDAVGNRRTSQSSFWCFRLN